MAKLSGLILTLFSFICCVTAGYGDPVRTTPVSSPSIPPYVSSTPPETSQTALGVTTQQSSHTQTSSNSDPVAFTSNSPATSSSSSEPLTTSQSILTKTITEVYSVTISFVSTTRITSRITAISTETLTPVCDPLYITSVSTSITTKTITPICDPSTVVTTVPTSKSGGFSQGSSLSSTCMSGSPTVTGGFTITYAVVLPTIAVANYVPSPAWAASVNSGGHGIGESNLYFGLTLKVYAEYLCQFKCGASCLSWFVSYNPFDSSWHCAQFNALLTPYLLVPAVGGTSLSGAAFDALCPPSTPSNSIAYPPNTTTKPPPDPYY